MQHSRFRGPAPDVVFRRMVGGAAHDLCARSQRLQNPSICRLEKSVMLVLVVEKEGASVLDLLWAPSPSVPAGNMQNIRKTGDFRSKITGPIV